MKLAIMQPYLLPYLGYFSLIKATDRFISFDIVQYIRHGWINRNRILHPSEGWQYFIVPVKKHARETLISGIEIESSQDWKARILGQLTHYKKRAPYYQDTIQLLDACLDAREVSMVRLNHRVLEQVCGYIGLPFNGAIASEMQLSLREIRHPGDWALAVCEALGATGYLNPVGGTEIFEPEDFKRAGVELKFLKMNEITYSQRRPTFEPWLSIVDVLMFNAPAEILKMLNQVELVEKDIPTEG